MIIKTVGFGVLDLGLNSGSSAHTGLVIFSESLFSLSFSFHVYKIGLMMLLPTVFVDRRDSVPVCGVTGQKSSAKC